MKTLFNIIIAIATTTTTSATTFSVKTNLLDKNNDNNNHRNLQQDDCTLFDQLVYYKSKELTDNISVDELKSFLCNHVFDIEIFRQIVNDPFAYFQGKKNGYCKAKTFTAILKSFQDYGKSLVTEEGTMDMDICKQLMTEGRRLDFIFAVAGIGIPLVAVGGLIALAVDTFS